MRARAAVFLSFSLLVACSAQVVDESGEPVAEIQQAYCWDHPLDPDAVLTYSEAVGGGNEIASTSPLPTGSYSHGNCIVGSYAVEVHGVDAATRPFNAFGYNYPVPTNQTACEQDTIRIEVWEEKLVFPFYDWVYVGDMTLQGQWVPFFGSGFCRMVHTGSSQTITFQPSVWRRKVALNVRTSSPPSCLVCSTRAKAGLAVHPDPPT